MTEAFRVFGLPLATSPMENADGQAVWVPDISGDEDLSALAALSKRRESRHWLWCGSAGLAYALASVHRFPAACNELPSATVPHGLLLVITASRHPVLRKQWAVAKELEKAGILVPACEPAALQSSLRAIKDRGAIAMLDLSPTPLLVASEAAVLLRDQMETIVTSVPRPAAVVVVGGNTLRALCDACATSELLAGPSPRSGWGAAHWVGGRWDGVQCFPRSGAFGAEDDLAAMARLLERYTAIKKEDG